MTISVMMPWINGKILFYVGWKSRNYIGVFTIINDSIKTFNSPNARKKKVNKDIPRQKQIKSYTAVLIGRIGVNKNYRLVTDETDRTGKQLRTR